MEAYDAEAEEYCKRTLNLADRSYQKMILDKTLDMFSDPPRILDIGCGDGRDTCYLRSKGADTVGIDLSKEMIKIALERYPQDHFLRMDMRDMGFRDESFDCLWASASLIHIPSSQLNHLVREMHRVLAPEGLVALSFKVGNKEGFEYGESMIDKPRYVVYHTKESIEEAFEGFEMVDMVEYPRKILGSYFAYCWLKKS